LVADLVDPGSVVMLVIPLDKEAPKGRLILPQVQVLRDLLDAGCIPMCVRDTEFEQALEKLSEPPALVIVDSQAFATVARMVPESIPLTSFSVAFSRFKGDLAAQALGTKAIGNLTESSRVLIAEACSHHAIGEDIGTVKIPRALRKLAGEGLTIHNVHGKEFPEDLSEYDLVIHCGGCMLNRRAQLARIQKCLDAGVPVSNYGLTLAYCAGVFERAIRAFPNVSGLF
ncbi:MAG: [Eggerthellaceae bacterium]|nr:[FeFe] hydrogenase H-cluster maturation GTPase HydF [Eggerthellaceae bacterium]